MAQLLSGVQLAREIVDGAAARAARFRSLSGRAPCLAAVLVGDDPASVTYVRMKRNRCEKAGIDSRLVSLPAETTTGALTEALGALSRDPGVDGILLQHPVPRHIDERAAFEAITPEKDVDGVTTASFAAMAFGLPGFISATPGGIVRLLDFHGVGLAGRHVVVLGRSPILGKPVAALLLARDATVTVCHSRTENLKSVVRMADIVVAAVGRPAFVKGEWLRPGAIVVDAGYHPGTIGDVDFDSASCVAGGITPVPGGVGPVTIAVLLEQTVTAAEHAAKVHIGRTG